MGQLTVKEKEHWKERLGVKVDQSIEKLIAESDPAYRESVAKRALAMAAESLGIADLTKRREEIEAEQKRLEQELLDVIRRMAAKVNPKSAATQSKWECEGVIKAATARRRTVHEQELMAQDPLGQQILRLEREKEELLDTVWLATSGAQIKALWSRVVEMLQQSPSELQQAALDLPPAEDS